MFHRIFVLIAGLALAASLALAADVAPAAAAEPETEAANAAVVYIKTLQNPDGGFPAFGEESAPGATIDAVFALVSAGQRPLDVTRDDNSPAHYLLAQGEEYAADPGAAAKMLLAVDLMGILGVFTSPDFGEVDLFATLNEAFDEETGSYGLDLFDHAFFILTCAEIVGGGAPTVRDPANHLRSLQLDDGGWEFLPGDGSDSNTTAIALQALLATRPSGNEPAVAAALEYLHDVQDADGGFGFLPGEESDPNSTALVIQALVAAGEDIDVGGPWVPNGHTPLEGLLAFWNPATGAFQYGGEDSPFATYQAVPALMLAPFPDLETRAFGEPTPFPTAIDLTPVEVSPTPTATATPEPGILPSTGGGPGERLGSWWALAALLAAGAGAVVAGVAGRRFR